MGHIDLFLKSRKDPYFSHATLTVDLDRLSVSLVFVNEIANRDNKLVAAIQAQADSSRLLVVISLTNESLKRKLYPYGIVVVKIQNKVSLILIVFDAFDRGVQLRRPHRTHAIKLSLKLLKQRIRGRQLAFFLLPSTYRFELLVKQRVYILDRFSYILVRRFRYIVRIKR